jgi:hypothetical protein
MHLEACHSQLFWNMRRGLSLRCQVSQIEFIYFPSEIGRLAHLQNRFPRIYEGYRDRLQRRTVEADQLDPVQSWTLQPVRRLVVY